MPLDRIVTDPIISTENVTFAPSRSHPPIEHLPLPSASTLPSEREPLVSAPKPKKPFYRARPLWLVPFALSASITRGMTLASRVQVFTELSCRQLHLNYNRPSTASDVQDTYAYLPAQASPSPGFTPLYLPSVPLPAQPLQESKGDGVSEGDDPRVIPGKKCISDPAVQAGAARLQTIMTATMGTLSALTTGWWGHFGERRGRTRVLAISTFGLFLTDLVFILVSTPHNPLAAHSHRLLILAPVIEGLLGGWSALTGASTAYITDCTSPGSRATIFARFTGVLSIGLALGPIIGAWLIRNPISFMRVGQVDHPLQSVNSVFWAAICGSFINLLLVLFVFPESLPASSQVTSRKGKSRAAEGDSIGSSDEDNHTWVSTRIIENFVSPLAEFLPTNVPATRPSAVVPSQQDSRKDWDLTFLALSLFIHTLTSGLLQLKYLYAEHVYNWAAEQLSYYISFMGVVRACCLLVILPLLLDTFKPVRAVMSSVISTQPNTNNLKAKPKPTKNQLFSEIRFDLLVVRCSMFVDFCSHVLVVLSPSLSNDALSAQWSQLMFVGATSLACASAGVMPAVQSLAVCALQGRKMAEKEAIADGGSTGQDAAPDVGKLFGAISVIQAVGQTILGPILFGVIYSKTVVSFPKAIFAVAGAFVMVAMVLTVFVNPRDTLSVLKNTRKKRKSRYVAEERRGRSRVSKDLRGGSASASYGAMRYNPSVSNTKVEASTSGYV